MRNFSRSSIFVDFFFLGRITDDVLVLEANVAGVEELLLFLLDLPQILQSLNHASFDTVQQIQQFAVFSDVIVSSLGLQVLSAPQILEMYPIFGFLFFRVLSITSTISEYTYIFS